MRWIEVEVKKDNVVTGKIWVNIGNVKAVSVVEIETIKGPKSKILGSKGTLDKKWFVNMILDKDINALKEFESKVAAEKWLIDYVVNA
jgi:hypothetical protein